MAQRTGLKDLLRPLNSEYEGLVPFWKTTLLTGVFMELFISFYANYPTYLQFFPNYRRVYHQLG